jgi:hypothetical protein
MQAVVSDPEPLLGPNFPAGVNVWTAWTGMHRPRLFLHGEQRDTLSRETASQMCASRPLMELVKFPRVDPTLMRYDQTAAVRGFRSRGVSAVLTFTLT